MNEGKGICSCNEIPGYCKRHNRYTYVKNKQKRVGIGTIAKKDLKEMHENHDIFCASDCPFLKPTENRQHNPKIVHTCKKFDKRVYHKMYHPKILKCMECVSL